MGNSTAQAAILDFRCLLEVMQKCVYNFRKKLKIGVINIPLKHVI